MESKRKPFLFVCIALLLATTGQAQIMTWDEFLNVYAENIGEQDSNNDGLERLEELHANPFNINKCTRDDLLQVPFISIDESDSILSYIHKNGPIMSAGELFSVNKLSYNSRKILPLFVRFELPDKEEKSLWQQIAKGHQEIAGVAHIPFYLYRAQNETYMCRSAENVVIGLCFSGLSAVC